MQFTAIEALYQLYLHRPPTRLRQTRPIPVWKHNILHDLESAWWVCVWATHYFKPVDDAGRSVRITQEHADGFKALFPVFGQDMGLRRAAVVTPVYHGEKFQFDIDTEIHSSIFAWLVYLHEAYTKSEQSIPDTGEVVPDVFPVVLAQALDVMDDITARDEVLNPYPHRKIEPCF